jgi:bifunctional DNA-binding transcriptional regulator/antitoxin component of YhaV-PrlF toxin-antitoxin module
MKEAKTEYYMQVQRRKTIKYGTKQHHQDYITIPAELSETLGLQPGQVMKCTLNGNGNSLTYTKTAEKANSKKMGYGEWRDRVKEFTPSTGEPGKTYEQIRREGDIPLRTAPALWVKLAETELGLVRNRDKKSHRVLWSLSATAKKPSSRLMLRDTKLTDIMPQFN